MKKSSALFICLVAITNAQTNTFPTSGNVGVGTTSPALLNGYVDKLLDIEGANSAGVSMRATSASGREYLWYSDSGGLLNLYDATANALRFTVNASGNVGIGTFTPQARLSLGTSIANTKLALYDDTVGPTIYGFGIQASQFRIHLDQAASRFSFLSAPAGTEIFTIQGTGNVGIGTTNPTQKLAVNGTIRAKEVIVDTGWSDYVFDDTYRLAPLAEVEAHIKAEKHLPGIPSAAEVARGGISLGDMQAKLLAKIEELTLHQIEQEKRIARLERENASLKNR